PKPLNAKLVGDGTQIVMMKNPCDSIHAIAHTRNGETFQPDLGIFHALLCLEIGMKRTRYGRFVVVQKDLISPTCGKFIKELLDDPPLCEAWRKWDWADLPKVACDGLLVEQQIVLVA